CSTTVTAWPRAARRTAAARPPNPLPMTTTRRGVLMLDSLSPPRASAPLIAARCGVASILPGGTIAPGLPARFPVEHRCRRSSHAPAPPDPAGVGPGGIRHPGDPAPGA